MSVELRHFRAFVAVSRHGSISGAATDLHLAQPALSRQIRQLEDRLGTALFERSASGVRLTEAGRALLPDARATLRAADRAIETGRRAARGEVGTLRLGFVADALTVFGELVDGFARSHPRVKIEPRETDFRDITGGLWGGAADAALLWGPLDDPGLEFRVLLEDPRVAVLPRRHRLARRRRISIRDLADDAFVVPPLSPSGSSAWRRFWLLDLFGDGRQPRFGPTPQTVAELWAAIAAGGAVATTPRSAAALHPHPGIAYVPIEDVSPATAGVAWRAGRVSPLVHAFTSHARRRATTASSTEGRPA